MTIDLNDIAAELADAKADLAQWERLTSAADRMKALVASYDKAKAAQAKADETAAKEAAEARFKGLSDLRVIKDGLGGHLLAPSTWRITWTQPVHDMYSGESIPETQGCNGFRGLPNNVLAFLIERHPEQVPAEIMALRPGDPEEAMAEYFRSVKRGYVRGSAAA